MDEELAGTPGRAIVGRDALGREVVTEAGCSSRRRPARA